MKSVMISIQPKWVEKILNGDKTVEVRKTKPKLETPFKCYIYCTQGQKTDALLVGEGQAKMMVCSDHTKAIPFGGSIGNGKVVGEFVCDGFDEFRDDGKGIGFRRFMALHDTCLSLAEMKAYLNGSWGYGWHISDLKVYDMPKALNSFHRWYEDDTRPCSVGAKCKHEYFDYNEGCHACEIDFDGEDCVYTRLTRPPQSWCYVEGE